MGFGGYCLRQPRAKANKAARPGEWVLVTGASAGIGRELARAFASRGCDLILAARNEAAIAALAREPVATHAVRAKTMPADLSLPGAAEAIDDAFAQFAQDACSRDRAKLCHAG